MGNLEHSMPVSYNPIRKVSRLATYTIFALAAGPLSAGTFDRTVLPVLQTNCTPCHDAQTRTSGFSVMDLKSFVAGGARHGAAVRPGEPARSRSGEHTSELQSQSNLVCRLLLEKKK